ncbi:MAG: DUF4129 domain-containing protein, partial [Dehalococcoidia bacterium]|nr:DUF4129 domain-containing protein [Dehalococcoidia bacterium]
QDELHSDVQVPVECRVWETGMRSLTVSASADEPWHRPSVVTARLMVVNMLIPLVVLLSLCMALGLSVLIGRRLRTTAAEPGPIPSPAIDVTADDVASDAAGRILFESGARPREMLARLYFQAVAMLQKSLGVRLRREMTLREYLASVRQRLGSDPRIFGRLTSLAEEAVYGPREIDSQSMRLGRRLLGMLRSAHANIEKDDTGDTQ